MADKKRKTQAEKAASASKTKKKSADKVKKAGSKSQVQPVLEKERQIPVRLMTSLVFLGLFILLIVIYRNPDGAISKLLANILLGLFGQVGFLVAIPSLLYLFIIHAFSGKRPVVMRTVCICALKRKASRSLRRKPWISFA